jgi:hypothetical protein
MPRGNHDPYRYREGFPPPRLPSITLDYPPVCTGERGKQWGMVLQVVGRPSGSCGTVGRPHLAAGGTLVPRRVGERRGVGGGCKNGFFWALWKALYVKSVCMCIPELLRTRGCAWCVRALRGKNLFSTP